MADTVPLSSLDMVPLTDETRQQLAAVGVGSDRIDGLSEMGGQSLLVLYQQVTDDEAVHAPACYRKEYDPTAAMCAGCVYAPRCWRKDHPYLVRLLAGEVPSPPGVPEHVVTACLHETESRPTPPTPPTQATKKRKPAPPPPPARPRKAAPPPPPPRRKR